MKRSWHQIGPMSVSLDSKSRWPIKVEFNEEAWPGKRQDRLEHDQLGLPVFCWRDPNSWLPRAVFVLCAVGDPPKALLVHVDGNYGGRGRRLKWMIEIPLSILGLLIFHIWWNFNYTISYSDVRYAPFDLSTAPEIATAAGELIVSYLIWPAGAIAALVIGWLAGRALTDLITKRVVWSGHGAKVSIRNWGDLTSFGIADTREAYGENMSVIEPLQLRQPRQLMITAYFGTGDSPVEVSRSTYNAVSVQDIHRILTLEFIQKRQAYLDRLSAPSRPQGAKEVPDRL